MILCVHLKSAGKCHSTEFIFYFAIIDSAVVEQEWLSGFASDSGVEMVQWSCVYSSQSL